MNNSLVAIVSVAVITLALSIGVVNSRNTTKDVPVVIADDTTIVKQGRFANFLSLKKYGVADDQIEETTNLINDYLTTSKINATIVELDPDSIDCGKTRDQCTFNVAIDSTRLKAEIGYTIFSAYRLVLSTPTGSVVFDNSAVEPEGGHNEG